MSTSKLSALSRGRCCIGLFAFVTLFLPGLSPRALADACSQNLTCGFDSCRTPAFATPVVGTHLLPVGNTSSGQLPSERDTTYWQEVLHGYSNTHPQWAGLDIANADPGDGHWIFTALRHGFEVWDATGNKAAKPVRVASLGKDSFPVWAVDPHFFWPVRDVAVPPGNHNLAALAVSSVSGGLAVFSTATKNAPQSKYGDRNKNAVEVHAARIKGTDYAFTATQGRGLLAHNLTAAAALPGPAACVEESPSQIACPGVYVGRLGDKDSYSFVGGTGNADGSRHWVVASTFGFAQGLEIWEVSNPASPVLRLSGLSGFPVVHGVALWRSGSQYLLGTRMDNGEARIYDVSCIATGGSCSLGTPIWTRNLAKNGPTLLVTHSTSGGRHFVYFGTVSTCTTTPAPQSEWLFDVTSPTSPFEMTEVGAAPSDYWNWYYRNTATGFNDVMPWRGKVAGGYFYRAARLIFDIHQLVNANPTITVTGPATGYAGESLGFTATASGGCTPTAGGWSWSASGGGDAGGSTGSTAIVSWSTVGSKSVSATNSGCPGAQQVPASINILDSTPAVGSVSASPTSVFECQPVTLTANGVTGQPPLAFSWEVTGPAPSGFTSSNANPVTWTVPEGITLDTDTFTAEVIVSGAGSSDPKSATVEVKALPPLSTSFTPSCTNCDAGSPPSPPFGKVDLSANAPGATEWNWDFGGGFTGWTSDPIAGPSPSHTYTTEDLKTIRVQVRNCKEGPVTSGNLVVEIKQVSPLIAGFQPQCSGFGCHLTTGQTLTFHDQTQGCDGGGCSWRYAYQNTSSASCSGYGAPQGPPTGNPPSTSFTYSSAGTFFPCVEVTRGAEVAQHRYAFGVTVSSATPPTPPSITVSGPSSGQVGQSLAFSAFASNCSPAANGWSWTATGVTVASNTSSASISFPSTGSKLVTATNSACGSASGSRSVSITGGSGDGGGTCGTQGPEGLRACFSFSPTSPQPGQGVSFNAGGSSGNPTGYSWKFGDGSEGSGAQAQHSFASSGSYQVTLTVTKSGNSCPFGLCSAVHTRTVTVSGSSPPPEGESLLASFTFSPASPEAGQEVSFDGSGSDGGPTSYAWDFGDGSAGKSGAKVTHTFDKAGTYAVKLDVTRTGEDCPFGFCTDTTTKQVTVTGVLDPNACVPTSEVACLLAGRFEVWVDFESQDQTGKRASGRARVMAFGGQRAQNDESVFLWFFGPENFEMGVKVLDACEEFGKIWVFQSGLTNQGYTVHVRDTVTRVERNYQNPLGTLPTTIGDTLAFDCDGAASQSSDAVRISGAGPVAKQAEGDPMTVGSGRQESGPCVPGPQVACLLGGRFEAKVTWDTGLQIGTGKVMTFGGQRAENKESVFMWFFNHQNFEMGIKMLDACLLPEFQSYWVFQSGLTNMGYTVIIRDTETGLVKTYTNPLGSFPTATADTKAFACP